MTRHVYLDGPEIPPAHFPYAQSEHLEDAPQRCPRCGGLWKLVSDGLQCRQCPGHWLVEAQLRELVGRVIDPGERFPVRVKGPAKKRGA